MHISTGNRNFDFRLNREQGPHFWRNDKEKEIGCQVKKTYNTCNSDTIDVWGWSGEAVWGAKRFCRAEHERGL